jgi:hypothetical protein
MLLQAKLSSEMALRASAVADSRELLYGIASSFR